MSQINTRQHGFTIIELTLAMTFISFLLIAIATIMIQMTNTYSRGLTVKAVNQAAREITASVRRDIAASAAFDPEATGPSQRFVSLSIGGTPVGARLCLGSVTYVWNYAEALKETSAAVTSRISVYSGADRQPVRLARVMDQGAVLCRPASVDGVLAPINRERATELLANDQKINLAIYAPQGGVPAVQRYAVDTQGAIQQGLYTVRFTIGTDDTGAIDTIDQSCRPPSDDLSNYEFCSVNRFEITARASNQ